MCVLRVRATTYTAQCTTYTCSVRRILYLYCMCVRVCACVYVDVCMCVCVCTCVYVRVDCMDNLREYNYIIHINMFNQ